MYETEILDLETAEGILLACDCPATAGNLRKVIEKLKALARDRKSLERHWESAAYPVVHSESLRCPLPLPVHYWGITGEGVRCLRCGYGQILTT